MTVLTRGGGGAGRVVVVGASVVVVGATVVVVARAGNLHELRVRDLCRHVLRAGHELRVVLADQHQCRYVDRREGVDDAGIALGEHPAGGEREPAAQSVAGLARRLVPPLARLVLAEAGPGVEQHQGAHAVGVGDVEGQRHVAPQREPGDHCPLRAGRVEERGHVGDGEVLRVQVGIGRRLALAVTAHVPHDHAPARVGERADLATPHLGRGGVAVAQQHDGVTLAVHLVVELDAVAIEERHQSRGATTSTPRAMAPASVWLLVRKYRCWFNTLVSRHTRCSTLDS